MTASRPMACSRISPMNDIHDRNDPINRDREDSPAVDPESENAPKHRPQVRRRSGGRLFAFGGFLVLAGGLSLGAWGDYSQRQGVMTTAKQERDFVPSVRVATVEASPSTFSVTL